MIACRDAVPADGPALAAMAAASFRETFGHLYGREDLEGFLVEAFGPTGLPAQIGDPAYAIRLATDGEAIAGFARLGRCTLPDPAPRDAAELKQLYVLKPWQGAGIAATLMDWAIDTARLWGAAHLALSVYSDNHRAKRFYARYGLEEIGFAPFRVGSQIDDDRIWMRAL